VSVENNQPTPSSAPQPGKIPPPIELKGPGAEAKTEAAAAAPGTVPADPAAGQQLSAEAPGKVKVTIKPSKGLPIATPKNTKIHSWTQIRRSASSRAILVAAAFAFIIAGVAGYFYQQSSDKAKKAQDAKQIENQNFDPNFDKAAGNQIKVGDSSHILTVQGRSFFQDRVSVDNAVDVNGPITITGQGTLSGLNVTGSSDLASANIKSNLVVAGTTDLQGAVTFKSLLTAAAGLNVVGNGSFSGDIIANNLTVKGTFNGTARFNGHVASNNAAPGISTGSGVGSAGTASIDGSDTAGTVTIGVGSGAAPGILATIVFRSSFGNTPRVIISPVGPQAGGLQYYTNRTSAGFQIATASAAGPGSYSFDYWVVGQ
jgi:hypothetical protein